MSVHHESEPRIYRCGKIACGVITHATCALFTGFITALARPGNKAILLFNPHSSPVSKLKHKAKGRLHWLLQCLCAFCALLGLFVIFFNKNLNDKPHFVSWHGLLGLVTVAIVVCQSLAGLPLLWPRLVKGWSLGKLKRYHATSGLLTHLLGSFSVCLGLYSSWFTGSVSGFVWYLSLLCPITSALTVMSQVTNAYMARKRTQF
ncbi:hypothetical protein DNTS_022976 [Danionella cerebrum]|uniref:ascorbate ferrireductase (transmembrane) n=1 Tax=Danionella cerebrum TaxID=2873325 RepID=A0A553RHH5_9TELE|nr:hypothetical protein DNTS_022976 [Danionella translucida]